MKLERTTTGLIIHNPDNIVKRKLLQYFSLVNPVREYFIYSGNDRSRTPIFGREHDVVYVTSGFLGINDPLIRQLPRPEVIQPMTPKTIELDMNREPRSQLQEDCIKMMISPNTRSNKITVELKPGVELLPAPAYGDVRVKYTPLNCWDKVSNAWNATA